MSSKTTTVPVRPNPELEDMLNRWAMSEEPNVGWCLLCDRPIRDLNDLIQGTNLHRCRVSAPDDVPLPELSTD
jgi:hypothetical protein